MSMLHARGASFCRARAEPCTPCSARGGVRNVPVGAKRGADGLPCFLLNFGLGLFLGGVPGDCGWAQKKSSRGHISRKNGPRSHFGFCLPSSTATTTTTGIWCYTLTTSVAGFTVSGFFFSCCLQRIAAAYPRLHRRPPWLAAKDRNRNPVRCANMWPRAAQRAATYFAAARWLCCRYSLLIKIASCRTRSDL
jgi:hypothetical protein